MSRRWAWIWILLALASAGGAGWLSFVTLQDQALAAQRAAQPLPTPTPIPTFKVPVAARDLPVGTALTDEDIGFAEFPVELLTSSAITDTSRLKRRVLVAPVSKGDIFRPSALRGGEGSSISNLIRQGMTLFALPVVDLMGQSGQIRAGDRIDLLLTVNVEKPEVAALLEGNGNKAPDTPQGTPGKATGYALQNIEVFRVLTQPVTEANATPAVTGLLLMLKPEDVVLVKAAKDSGGSIDLLLRSPQDNDSFKAPPVTERQLVGALEELRNGGR